MDRFEGKVALITGAASGIGRAVAMRLTAEGVGTRRRSRDTSSRLAPFIAVARIVIIAFFVRGTLGGENEASSDRGSGGHDRPVPGHDRYLQPDFPVHHYLDGGRRRAGALNVEEDDRDFIHLNPVPIVEPRARLDHLSVDERAVLAVQIFDVKLVLARP